MVADRRSARLERLEPRALSRRIVDQLKRVIIAGELRPGDRVLETDLAEQLGVSRGPVREAFRQLEQEGRQEDALKHYEAAVATARTSAHKRDLRFCWDGLVQFHYNKGDQAKAVEASREMLKDCPELEAELKVETIRNDADKTGRNDPCPCGSGRKFKKCCGAAK